MPVTLNRLALCLVIFAGLSIALAARAAERDVRVLHHESLDADFRAIAGNAQTTRMSSARTMRFGAFGRSFQLDLEPNARIPLGKQSQALAYRGTVSGRDRSWARITRVGAAVHGLFFDGNELFAIEPAAAINARTSSGLAIFRLSDTTTELGAEFCSVADTPPKSGNEVVELLGLESRSLLSQAQSSARMRLEVTTLTDPAFRGRYANEQAAADAIVARMNNIDGIFTSQVGVEIEILSTQDIATDTTLTNPDALLQSVSRLRAASPTLYAGGTTHLFTGVDLDGMTVGIAYIDSVCNQQFGASLSEARDRGAWFDSLVAAHEIGHSFGSPHDGQGQCAATPTNYLMAPTINGSNQFSQCSLGIIQARVQTASCLVPIPLPDISVATPPAMHVAQNQSFEWSLDVSNIGTIDSAGSQVELRIPAALRVNSAAASGTPCTIGAGVVDCDLGTLASRASRTIRLSLNATETGSFAIETSVTANQDFSSANNASNAMIRVDPAVDVAVNLTLPDSAALNQNFNAVVALANKSGVSATNLAVDIALPPGLAAAGTAQLDGVSCQVQFQSIHCSLAMLSANRSVSGSLALVAHDSGAQMITATVDGSYVDPQPQDNIAQKSVMIAAATAAAPVDMSKPNGQSGGGALGGWLLLALGGLATQRRRHVRR